MNEEFVEGVLKAWKDNGLVVYITTLVIGALLLKLALSSSRVRLILSSSSVKEMQRSPADFCRSASTYGSDALGSQFLALIESVPGRASREVWEDISSAVSSCKAKEEGTLHLSEKELAHILSHCRAELVLLRPRTAVIVLGVLQALVPLCSQHELFYTSGVLRTLCTLVANNSVPISLRALIVDLIVELVCPASGPAEDRLEQEQQNQQSSSALILKLVSQLAASGLDAISSSKAALTNLERRTGEECACGIQAIFLGATEDQQRDLLEAVHNAGELLIRVILLPSTDVRTATTLYETGVVMDTLCKVLKLVNKETGSAVVTLKKRVLVRGSPSYQLVWPVGTLLEAHVKLEEPTAREPGEDADNPSTVILSGAIPELPGAITDSIDSTSLYYYVLRHMEEQETASVWTSLGQAFTVTLLQATLPKPKDTKGKLELLRALSARARLLFRLGKYEEAERGYQQAAKYGKNQKIDNSAGSKCTNAATLQTGTLVAAKKNKRDQRHSPGIISDVNGDGTCDIIFDDGDEACDVPVSELKILQGQLKDSEDEKELQSEAYKCLINASRCFIKVKRFMEVYRRCTEAIDLDPSPSSGYFLRAKALMALGKLKHAQKDLDVVKQLDPDSNSTAAALKELQHLKNEEAKKDRKLVKLILNHVSNVPGLNEVEDSNT